MKTIALLLAIAAATAAPAAFLGATGCAHQAGAPTPAQVGAGVRDCTACVRDTAPIITSIFGSCAHLDAGADR